MSRPRSHKRDREKARREKAAAKAVRREERRHASEPVSAPTSPDDQARVLAELADLHRRFADEEISFEDFDAAKQELTARLDVA